MLLFVFRSAFHLVSESGLTLEGLLTDYVFEIVISRKISRRGRIGLHIGVGPPLV